MAHSNGVTEEGFMNGLITEVWASTEAHQAMKNSRELLPI